MTLTLIYPPFRFRPPIWPESRPPLVIAHLYALLEKARLREIRAIDLDLELNDCRESIDQHLSRAVKRVEEDDPSVLCLTCKSAQFPFAALFSRKYKTLHPESKIVMGGWMPTLSPELVLNLSDCDAVVRGEAEKSLPELLKRIGDGEWTIDGLSYKGSDQIIHNNPNSKPLTQKDLDALPMPNYDCLPPTRKYFRGDRPCFTVEASRGCPHGRCIFCWNSTRNCSTTWRARSPKRVIKEIRRLLETYGSRIFFFADDNFGAHPAWLSEFVSRMSAEFQQGEVGYVASMRIDSLTERMIPALHRSGLRTVFHGIESGSPECWRTIRKGFDQRINTQYILDLARKELEAGIAPMFSFVAGIPSETEKDLDETVTLCRQLTDLGALVTTQILAPHRGTALYELYPDLIEPYDVYHELGRSENFQLEYHNVFGDKLREFHDLPDFKRVKSAMRNDRFMEKYSLLPGSIIRPQ